MPKPNLKDQILEVSQDYLGPAAERFIDRQITTHLGKDASKITHDDVIKLIDWLKLSFALLTKDSSVVDEYGQRLLLIATGKGKEATGRQWARR